MEKAAPERAGSFMGKAGPLVLARFVSALLTAFIPLVLARRLSLPDYGSFKQLILIFQTLYFVLPFGVPQSLYFFIPREPERARAWFGQSLIYLTGAAMVCLSLLFAFEDNVARYFNNPTLLIYKWELAVYTAGFLASIPLEPYFTTRGKTRVSAFFYLGSDLSRALALVVPVLMGLGLRGAMVTSATVALIRYTICWHVLLGSGQGPIFKWENFSRQWIYAAPFGAAMVLNFPQQAAHQYAVSSLVTPAVYAIYAVGIFQLPLVDLLYTPTSEVLMVRLGELDRKGRMGEAVSAFREAASRLVYVFLPLSAFLFAAAPEFIEAMFGSRFLGAVPIFRVSVLGIALSWLPMDGVLRARNSTRHLFASYLVKSLVTIPLVYFGVHRLGMVGGIGAWAVAEVVGKLMLFIRVPFALSPPERRLDWMEVVPFRALGLALLAALSAGGMVALLRSALPGFSELPETVLWRSLPLAVAGTVFGIGYLGVLRVAGVRPLAVWAEVFRRPR